MANKWNSTTLVDDNFTKDDVNKALLDLLAKANTAYSNAGTQITKGQIYTQYSGTPTPASLYGGTWTNITSTIGLSGQSGIYASGSNTYGNYIQYADGTMVQWGITPLTLPAWASEASGTLVPATLFPLGFISTPVFEYSVQVSQGEYLGYTIFSGYPTTTAYAVYARNVSNVSVVTANGNLYWQATGKWSATAVTPSTFWQCSSTYGTTASNNPTLIQSAVYASGNDGNGNYYVKYTDGTMVCWGITASQTTSITYANGFYYSAGASVTFPQPFISTPSLTTQSANPALTLSWAICNGNVTATGATGIGLVSSSNVATSTVCWQAIGKWSSQTVPAPTGGITVSGIYDSGSNTYGNWIRYTDGTMTCWQYISLSSYACTTATGSSFTGSGQNWNFPQSFISPAVVNISGFCSWAGVAWANIGTSSNTTGVGWNPVSSVSNTGTFVGYLTATGKWANGIQTSSNTYTVTAQATVAMRATYGSQYQIAGLPLVATLQWQVGTGTWSGGTFTVGTAGIYLVTASAVNSAVSNTLGVYRNSSNYGNICSYTVAGFMVSGSTLVQCNVGDTIFCANDANLTISTYSISINKVN